MKASWFIGYLLRAWAFAGKTEFAHSLYTFHAFGHLEKFALSAISKPKTKSLFAVDKFFRALPRPEILLGQRLLLYEVIQLFFRKEIVAVINGLVADADSGHIANRLGAAFDINIWRGH